MNPHVARLDGVEAKERRVTVDNEVVVVWRLASEQRREGQKRLEKEGLILGGLDWNVVKKNGS